MRVSVFRTVTNVEKQKWLAKKEIDFEFIDFRKQALTAEDIKRWIKNVGEKLINKRGTTW